MFKQGREAIDQYLRKDDWYFWVAMKNGQVIYSVYIHLIQPVNGHRILLGSAIKMPQVLILDTSPYSKVCLAGYWIYNKKHIMVIHPLTCLFEKETPGKNDFFCTFCLICFRFFMMNNFKK